MAIKDNPVSRAYCPNCFGRFDELLPDRDGPPHPGDVTICTWCGMALVFTPGLRLKELLSHEFDRLPEKLRKRLIQAQELLRQIQTEWELWN